MEKVLDFLKKKTYAIHSYKSYKYCFEGIEVPSIIYDDKQDITFEDYGETDHSIKTSRSLFNLAIQIKNHQPLFKYFLDGSRHTYKVDDFAYDKRVYPIIAGQIGVGCCIRESLEEFKSLDTNIKLVISLPECADKDGHQELFFRNVLDKLNQTEFLKQRNIIFQDILVYSDKEISDGEEYKKRGIAKIQDEMVDSEKRLVVKLAQNNKLDQNSFLLKDGSLEYQQMKYGDFKDLATFKTNYRCVIGASKSFNPELCKDKDGKSIAKKIADLELYHRTPAIKYSTPRIPDVEFSVWYLRIRETISPFAGILKVEKVLVTDTERRHGLDSDEVDLISANLINERNPTCYGLDQRWANHLYPIYLTETFIKSRYLSEHYFLNLF